MTLEKIAKYGMPKTTNLAVHAEKVSTTYSGLQKLEETTFKGGTSIKYWM